MFSQAYGNISGQFGSVLDLAIKESNQQIESLSSITLDEINKIQNSFAEVAELFKSKKLLPYNNLVKAYGKLASVIIQITTANKIKPWHIRWLKNAGFKLRTEVYNAMLAGMNRDDANKILSFVHIFSTNILPYFSRAIGSKTEKVIDFFWRNWHIILPTTIIGAKMIWDSKKHGSAFFSILAFLSLVRDKAPEKFINQIYSVKTSSYQRDGLIFDAETKNFTQDPIEKHFFRTERETDIHVEMLDSITERPDNQKINTPLGLCLA